MFPADVITFGGSGVCMADAPQFLEQNSSCTNNFPFRHEMSSGLHHPLIRQILSNIYDLVVCNFFDHVDPHVKEEGTRQQCKDKKNNLLSR